MPGLTMQQPFTDRIKDIIKFGGEWISSIAPGATGKVLKNPLRDRFRDYYVPA